ncbi:MAG TPA: hypothetical protein PLM74_04350 [Bacillota bacterium]|nr:hypothetical protein [Bacillota bacterium]
MSGGELVSVPQDHGLRGMIACITDQVGQPGLMVLDVASGSSAVLASADCSWRSVPAVAPSGDRVALQGADGRLKVVNVIADQTESMGEPIPGLITPKWSPGGNSIMYELDAATYVVDLDEAHGQSSLVAAMATWMGDGSRIAYVADSVLHARDTWTGQAVQLTEGPERIWGLAASLDGAHAAYVASDDEGALLRVVDIFTREAWDARTSRGIWPWSLTWSPDGKMLAYCVGGSGERGGQRVSVYMVDARGISASSTVEPNIVAGVVSDPQCAGLAWSPDSQAVAIAARTSGSGRYAVHAITRAGETHQLTEQGNCILPDWGPSPI